jgi:hypothetical protein
MSSQHPHGSLDNPDTAHEESDINVRAIIGFVVVLTVIVLAVDVAMWALFKVFAHMEVKNDPIVTPLADPPLPPNQPPGPTGLQTTPWADLKQFRASQNAYLHGYGWVDEPGGIARVPIEKAKEMLLKRGLPVRPDLADPLEGTHVAADGESNGGRTLPAGQADRSAAVTSAPQAAAPPVPATPPKPGGGGHD